MKYFVQIISVLLVVSFSTSAFSEETATEKVEIQAEKATNSVKRGYRRVKDKTCELVDGKMNCVGKKIKHKLQNASDRTSTKAKELKNKVD